MANKLLLIEDVENLGRSGEIVSVRPGYARNFLLPQGFAVTADKSALRMQARLQEERKQKAIVEKAEAEKTAKALDGIVCTTIVKVDHEGHMYGSVNAHDVVELVKAQAGVQLEKRSVQLKHPIKTIGVHEIEVKLPEGISSQITIKVMSEAGEAETKTEAAS